MLPNIFSTINWRQINNLKKVALVLHDFAENFYLIWFVNCKTIESNLYNVMKLP